MNLLNRTAVIVVPKKRYIDWANSLDDDGVKFGDNPSPEYTVYLVEEIPDFIGIAISFAGTGNENRSQHRASPGFPRKPSTLSSKWPSRILVGAQK